MRRFVNHFVENHKVALLTFEIFWIFVFLLDAAAGTSGSGIAQFVYVNF